MSVLNSGHAAQTVFILRRTRYNLSTGTVGPLLANNPESWDLASGNEESYEAKV
jgi:hypothetical protein